ncbi:MAG: DUF4352 domain-containing protein [Lachnospiraceae bacterium]|nr:DUF4352 domain-containing protein [Lachnospiraceae bacterium]
MKKNRAMIAMLLVSVLITTTGCGEALYELTEEEQDSIVSYSAHVIAKYNTYQSDGIVYVNPESLVEETEVESEEVADLTEDEALESEDITSDEGMPESDTQSEGTDSSVFGSDQTYNGEGYGSIENLSKALDLGQVTAEYMGYDITSEYIQDEVFSMTADSGRDYFVVNIRLNNNSSNTYNIDLLNAKPRFKLLVDDESVGSSITTLLMNDLSTYQGELAPGESVDTVLLFSVVEGACEDFESLGLSVTMNDETNNILF